MKVKFRIIGAVLATALVAAAVYYARSGQSTADNTPIFEANKTTIRLWYTDEALTDYLTGKAVEFNNMNNNARVELECVSGLEYLEAIGKASVENNNFPDVFITTHDCLEKAYLAGLACEVTDMEGLSYSDSALNAVSYKGKYIAYPYYFETSSLLYNKTYLADEAKAELQAEIDAAEGEAAQAEIDAGNTPKEDETTEESSENSENVEAAGSEKDEGMDDIQPEAAEEEYSDISQEQIDEKVASMLPNTIEDVLLFADNYNAPEAVESVFEWDVTDIFYNYFFVGNYLNLGGPAGDDISQINVYNEDAINCMSFYQQLNQFFAIDEEVVTYDHVMQDFIDGKTVFTVATTDAVSKIEEAKANGNCNFEYGVATMPALNSNYGTRTMSVTDCLVVNGFSDHREKAKEFAKFLASENTDSMYRSSGKLLASQTVAYENDSLNSFVSVYANSVPMPKLMATSNFWVQLEIAFANIWDGANVNDTLKTLSESVKLQINGEAVEEERLPDPTVIITDAE